LLIISRKLKIDQVEFRIAHKEQVEFAFQKNSNFILFFTENGWLESFCLTVAGRSPESF